MDAVGPGGRPFLCLVSDIGNDEYQRWVLAGEEVKFPAVIGNDFVGCAPDVYGGAGERFMALFVDDRAVDRHIILIVLAEAGDCRQE